MIFLLCKSEEERAAAITALARHCASTGAHIVYCGPRAPLPARIPGKTADCRADRLDFIPFDPPPDAIEDEALSETFHMLGERLAHLASPPLPRLLWIECPLAPRALADRATFAAYEERLARFSAPSSSSIVSAHLVPDAADPLLGVIFQRRRFAVTASMLESWSPAWLFEAPPGEDPSEKRATMQPPADLAQYVYSENSSEIGLMAAGIAHELSNPLTLISSSLQYLHERLSMTNDAAREFTMAALANVERMHGLLETMRTLGAPKGLALREVDLNALVFDALRFVSDECRRREIVVESAFATPTLFGRFDAARVTQVILNLLLNAIQASGDHGYLRVSTEISASGEDAIIAFENTGAPIPGEVRKNLFRPFFTTKPSGTGLGLYISRQNARAHGGTIQLQNLPSGVKFTVTLSLRLPR